MAAKNHEEKEHPYIGPGHPAPGTPTTQPAPRTERIITVQEEQLARSAEIEKDGVDKWKDRHDTRDPKDRPQAVAGVGVPTQLPADEPEHERRGRR